MPVSAARAHPHAFIDASLSLVVIDGRITALDVTWRFDDADTELALENNDDNGNGRLDAAELKDLARRMRETSGGFGHHVHLTLDGKPLTTGTISDFRAAMHDKRLEAQFRLTLPKPVDPTAQRFRVGLYDQTFWISFSLDIARDLRITAALPRGCQPETFKDRDTVIYEVVGQKVHPTVTEIACGS